MTLKMTRNLALTDILAAHGTAHAEGTVDAPTIAPVPTEAAMLQVWSFLPDNYEAGADAYAAVKLNHQMGALQRSALFLFLLFCAVALIS